MKTRTVNTYLFEELDEEAQEVARNWYREGMCDFDWYEYVYNDAKEVGITIESFEVDRYCNAKFAESAEYTAHQIEAVHGEVCETYKTSKAYLKERDELIDNAPRDEDGEIEDEYELDNALDEIDSEYLKALEEDYRIMLRKEYEWINSDESIDENITCNEYEFTEDGKRFG